jgi:hypothetical protein
MLAHKVVVHIKALIIYALQKQKCEDLKCYKEDPVCQNIRVSIKLLLKIWHKCCAPILTLGD